MPLLDFISLTLIFNLPALCVGLTHGNGFQRPNIVLIVADDLGWADVSWRDSTVYTPVLDRLAKEGMILNASYVQSSCSPSRGALMTGKYPFRLGLQHTTIAAGREHYLTDNVTILPQYLKQLGYATHIVGKWHLGFCDWRFTPTYRGFDSFYGYYNAAEGYYSHIGKKNGYDFRNNTSVDWSAKGEYSTYLFAKRAQKILRSHNKSQPLFLYLPFQAVHGPFEVPEHYFQNRCKNISDSQRRAHCGMAVALDEAIGNISRTMEVEGFLNNTLIIFTTDNGGPTNKGSSNWPLRGAKTTLWEGGHRAVAFIHSRTLLQAQGTIYSGLIHIVDWLPTLLAAAGSDKLLTVTDIDGINLWNHIRRGIPSPRDEFVYNIDEVDGNAALRMGRFKLIQGKAGKPDGWYYPPSSNQKPQPRKPRGLKSPDGRSKSRGMEPEIKSSRDKHDKNTKSQTSRKKGEKNRGKETNKGKTQKQRPKEVPDKKKQRPGKAKDKGKTPAKEPQIFLFDLEADPAETNNIAAENAKVVQRMLGKLEVYRRGLVPSIDGPFIKKAHPKFLPLDLDKAEEGKDLVNLPYTEATATLRTDGTVFLKPDPKLEQVSFELPQINYVRCNARKYQYAYGTKVFSAEPQLIKVDLEKRSIMIWQDKGYMPGEPVFVPKPDALDEDDGVILSAVISMKEDMPCFLLILDAKTFQEVARAKAPVGLKMAFTFHGLYRPLKQ